MNASRNRRRSAGFLLTAVAALSGCTGGSSGVVSPTDGGPRSNGALTRLLLEPSDVSGTDASSDLGSLPGTPLCTNVSLVERRVEDNALGGGAVRRLVLAEPAGTTVFAAVYKLTNAASELSAVELGIQDCVRVTQDAPLGGPEDPGTFSLLDGLPASAVGYQLGLGGSGTDRQTRQRAYATTGSILVVVEAGNMGDAVPVSVPDLLATAIAKAKNTDQPS